MTNEEWDRKVEFLLNQQARFDADMQGVKQELKEAQKNSELKIAKVTEATALAVEAVSQLTDVTAHLANTMFEGFRVVSDHMQRTDEKIDIMVDSQVRTDERIRDLFERHIREHHSGPNGALKH